MKNSNPGHNHNNNVIKVVEEAHYSGPLPRPEDLAKYDQVVPGSAERIIAMAEREMAHRHEGDRRTQKGVITTTIISICFAFISVIILSGLTLFALIKGYEAAATSIAVGSIAAVAGVFIAYKSKQDSKKE